MPGLEHTGLTGQLTVTGESGDLLLHGPAWDLPDVRRLWMSALVRGQDRTRPLEEGQAPRRRRRTGTEHLLPLYISGEVDPAGEPVDCYSESEFMANIRVNIDHLLAEVLKPVATVAGTRAVSLLVPGDPTPRAGEVHFLNLEPGELRDDGLAMKAVLQVVVPYPSQFIAG